MNAQTAEIVANMPVLFEIIHRHKIWTITKDFAFFGDFTQEKFAIDAVEAAVAAIGAAGGTAQIVSKVA
ncbi:hypothetical protein MMA231_03684 (plasmid) [Asticcacaulis sp. MM231]|uniref:hypothetical protein n=1 Tax=Asticcacaulis sp. MM231 TaxID=3157666 RepID=UPI0032D56B2A